MSATDESIIATVTSDGRIGSFSRRGDKWKCVKTFAVSRTDGSEEALSITAVALNHNSRSIFLATSERDVRQVNLFSGKHIRTFQDPQKGAEILSLLVTIPQFP